MKILKGIIFGGLICAGLMFTGAAAFAETKGKIVAFWPGREDPWQNIAIKVLQQEAKRLNYDIEIIENGYFNQQKQDEQVAQYLQTGEVPSAFLWFPAESEAGLGSLRALAKTGAPVILAESIASESAKPYLAGEWTLDNTDRAKDAVKTLLEARDALVAGGHKLHSEGGNVLIVSWPCEYAGTKDTVGPLKEELAKTNLKLVDLTCEGFGAANAYTGAQQMISKHAAEGFDLIYSLDDDMGNGTLKAFREAGYTPGKDINFVGSICNGVRSNFVDGAFYSTQIVSPFVSIPLGMDVAMKAIEKGGKLEPFQNFYKGIPVKSADFASFSYTDKSGNKLTMDDLCPWSK